MRKIIFLFLALSVLVFSSCSKEKETPKHYFDSVIMRTDSVVTYFNTFINASTYNQLDTMKLALLNLDLSANYQQSKINKIENWKQDSSLKIAAADYVINLQKIGSQELKMMMAIYLECDTLISDENTVRLDSIAAVMDLKINAIAQPFLKAQSEFAKKNNFKLNFNYEIDQSLKSGMDTTVLIK